MEGRDIATVVVPEARLKLYLVADPKVRAARRALERSERGGGDDVDDREAVADALRDRDVRDMRVNPFRPTQGAVELDTTDMDISQTIEAALTLIRERAPDLLP